MKKWFAPVLVYIAVVLGLFVLRNAWAGLLGFHFAIIISLLSLKADIPLQILYTGSAKWSLISILLCGSSGMGVYLLWDKFGISGDIARHVEAMGLSSSTWIPYILYFTLVNPWVEEYFWRAFLGSKTTNPHISDFLYSGFHGLILLNNVGPGMILYSLILLVLAGWFWRQAWRIDQGLLASVLGHMAADLTILLSIYSKIQG